MNLTGMITEIASRLRLPGFLMHKDRVKPLEVWRRWGGLEVASRPATSQVDVSIVRKNANAFIAVSAISQAIMMLPVNIIGTEVVRGVEREFDDNDHPANDLINNPNPIMTMREVIKQNVTSYLTDGNGYNTIERATGPNARIELWPRDPRPIEIKMKNNKPVGYIFGQFTPQQVTFPTQRVVHIRDMSPDDPFYGMARHESVRKEIEMDAAINDFNGDFFTHGASLGAMFNPDTKLSDDQHDQLMDALNDQLVGKDNWWTLFVNKFPGSLDFPEQKHKDIAFQELLKNNREKIFGVYHLPPFRGGVMEFANYANALAQDADFWLNTITPITATLEDAYNKQLIWPVYGDDVKIVFDFSGIPALQGDKKQQAEVHKIYVDAGVMTPNEVREDLGMKPLKETPVEDPDEATDPNDQNEPEEDEDNALTPMVFLFLRQQGRRATAELGKALSHGRTMSMIYSPELLAARIVNDNNEGQAISNALGLTVNKLMREAGVSDADKSKLYTVNALDEINAETRKRLSLILSDADRFNQKYNELTKSIRSVFNSERAGDVVKHIERQANHFGHEHGQKQVV